MKLGGVKLGGWPVWPDLGSPDAIERWGRTRAMGRSAFIWRHGVLSYGVPAGALTSVYHLVRLRGRLWPVSATADLWLGVAIAFGVCGMAGYQLGARLWAMGEEGPR